MRMLVLPLLAVLALTGCRTMGNDLSPEERRDQFNMGMQLMAPKNAYQGPVNQEVMCQRLGNGMSRCW